MTDICVLFLFLIYCGDCGMLGKRVLWCQVMPLATEQAGSRFSAGCLKDLQEKWIWIHQDMHSLRRVEE